MTVKIPIAQEVVREFVIAGHSDLAKVKSMLDEQPDLLNEAYQWSEHDFETAVQAAGHMGNRPIAEYLLEKGALLDICIAAMLGREDDVARFLQDDPAQAQAVGAHGIPLMAHAAMSGSTSVVQMIYDAGGNAGMSFSLFGAISFGHVEMVRWLLEHGANNLTVRNYQSKTPLELAVEREQNEIAALLREYGAEA